MPTEEHFSLGPCEYRRSAGAGLCVCGTSRRAEWLWTKAAAVGNEVSETAEGQVTNGLPGHGKTGFHTLWNGESLSGFVLASGRTHPFPTGLCAQTESEHRLACRALQAVSYFSFPGAWPGSPAVVCRGARAAFRSWVVYFLQRLFFLLLLFSCVVLIYSSSGVCVKSRDEPTVLWKVARGKL